jgi:para-aminobenzoate synthetase/4-amino-4-deoxychorismate lyase
VALRSTPLNVSRNKYKDFRISNVRTNISQEQYFADIERIRQHIALGDVYQITYCLKLLFDLSGDAQALYRTLLHNQPVPYPACIETDRYQILSLSPEMFLKKTGERVVTKPMKGSWPLGEGFCQDLAAPLRLHWDKKNRAENVMIADLLRNDLGRVGTRVQTPKLFEVARYRTICQMTSTVEARVDESVTLEALMRALFPSGSVTGAPKVMAMEIIRALEPEERKIYTGAIGFITPQRDMFFNVPIRTLLLEDGCGEMGIGGGIVWDSTPEGEWAETMWKARFFTAL